MRPQSPCGTAGETGSESHSESSEDIRGINPESTGLVAAAIAAAALLAIAVWFTRLAVALAVIVFGLVFAGFDVREVVHQVNESRAGLVIIACVLVAVHLGVSLLAAVLLRAGPQFGIRAAPFVHPRGRRYGLSGPETERETSREPATEVELRAEKRPFGARALPRCRWRATKHVQPVFAASCAIDAAAVEPSSLGAVGLSS